MKYVLTLIAVCAFVFSPTQSLLAEQHMMEKPAGEKQSEMQQERSTDMERKRSMQSERMGGKEQREMTRQQAEQGMGDEQGEKERNRKWWRFWE